jgi:hypothetical protein
MWSLSILGLVWGLMAGSESPALECAFEYLYPDRSQVVFRLESPVELVGLRKGKRLVAYLLVDQDDRIRLVSFDLPGCGDPGDRVLGTRMERSGGLVLSDYVAPGEVPFLARRLSLAPDLVIHVVLTWGRMPERLFEKFADPENPEYWPDSAAGYDHSPVVFYSYFLRESGKSVELLHKEDHGTGFIEFDFVDATGDGKKEAVLTAVTWVINRRMQIWRIDSQGRVSRVPLPVREVEYAYPKLHPASPLEPPKITTTKSWRDGNLSFDQYGTWKWDEQRQAFVLRHTVTEQRRLVEP